MGVAHFGFGRAPSTRSGEAVFNATPDYIDGDIEVSASLSLRLPKWVWPTSTQPPSVFPVVLKSAGGAILAERVVLGNAFWEGRF